MSWHFYLKVNVTLCMILFFSMLRRTTRNRCSVFFVSATALCVQIMWVVLVLLFQTNFNTVLTREKMRKENIINDLSDKLKSTMQQQERDKGERASGVRHLWLWPMRAMANSVPTPAADLIESLSEDRARLLEEKKRLEEEVSRLRGGAFVPSPGVAAAPELYGACAPEPPVEALDTFAEGRPDSAMETSTMSVQWVLHPPVQNGQPALRVGGLGSPGGDRSLRTWELDPVDCL